MAHARSDRRDGQPRGELHALSGEPAATSGLSLPRGVHALEALVGQRGDLPRGLLVKAVVGARQMSLASPGTATRPGNRGALRPGREGARTPPRVAVGRASHRTVHSDDVRRHPTETNRTTRRQLSGTVDRVVSPERSSAPCRLKTVVFHRSEVVIGKVRHPSVRPPAALRGAPLRERRHRDRGADVAEGGRAREAAGVAPADVVLGGGTSARESPTGWTRSLVPLSGVRGRSYALLTAA